ncbi:MAG: hypothetical protein OEZ59_05990 [Deltaproteobacteria bacterium]|nr:hypothetical protein [Deltaproteobacteria bacterium]
MSPTSRVGQSTNTTPHGAYLKPMNPLSLMLGISNVSFLAQTATWLPVHMDATIRKAWTHKGMSFVRIMQRCPIYMPHMFTGAGAMNVTYLDHPNGVEVDKALAKKSKIITHDPFDMLAAQEVALIEDSLPMGLLYHNPKLPSYEADRYSRVAKLTNQELIDKMNSHLDKYTVRTSP